MNKRVYLDYAATTPLDSNVMKAMTPYFTEKFGNPMSVHGFGREAMEAIDNARQTVADFLHSQPSEIIFTSGATESNNLAIKGVLKSYSNQNRKEKPHIILSQIEHHCVLDTVRKLEKEGAVEATYLPVYKDGIVKVEDVKKAIRLNTILVSMMYVNNEIGTIQPIREIGEALKDHKLKTANQKPIYPLFHTDATQAMNYFDCNVEKLGVDLLSFSGHKIYGPKGVGVLYVKKRTPILRIQDGGDQEYNLRAGTHNMPGIVGLGAAIERIKNQESRIRKINKLRDYLIEKVLEEVPRSHLNGSQEFRSPNNANFRFDDVEGEGLLLSLDMEGIAASTGSACSSGALEPSHVLLALGLKHEQAHGSLRITLGKNTTREEINYTVKKIKEVVERLRKISGSILTDYNQKN